MFRKNRSGSQSQQPNRILLTPTIKKILEEKYNVENDPDFEEIVTAIKENKEILAVKLYRQKSGAGLLEAKQAIDWMKLQIESSE